MTQPSSSPSMRRRSVLTSVAVGAAALTSGCMRRMRTLTGWQSSDQVTLEIKTVSADADPYALRIANHVADWHRTAGIDTTVTPMSDEELLRQVLLNREFDLFVTRTPGWISVPDAFYSLLHSRFVNAAGWQNPFGYTNLTVDGLLETQRRATGKKRHNAITQLQQTIATTQPFTAIGFSDGIRAVRNDRYTSWRDSDLRSALGYLALEQVDESEDHNTEELAVVMNDARPTRNLNPLGVEFRRTDDLTGLLYDALGYARESETIEPWLADSWEFPKATTKPVATVTIPSGLTWHDGTPLTANDIEFTYAFLSDTSLGGGGNTGSDSSKDGPDAVPAPRFQGQSDLVADVHVLGPQTAEFQFVECHPQVANRAFTVPILPKHIWKQRTKTVSVGGIELGTATEALITKNIPPVGSGPLKFVRNDSQRSLVLETFDEHFLSQEKRDNLPSSLASGLPFDRLIVRAVGSDVTAVEMVAAGETDVTATAVGAELVPRIGRSTETELVVNRATSFYFVGYNARRTPLTNPRFRNTLAQLIDKKYIMEEVFDEYGAAAASSFANTDWLPSSLEWNKIDPVTPFLGDGGELNVERARESFRSIGYQYNDGQLVGE